MREEKREAQKIIAILRLTDEVLVKFNWLRFFPSFYLAVKLLP